MSAFPSEKYLNFLPVHLYFDLSRTGGQHVISIPEGPPAFCGAPGQKSQSKMVRFSFCKMPLEAGNVLKEDGISHLGASNVTKCKTAFQDLQYFKGH